MEPSTDFSINGTSYSTIKTYQSYHQSRAPRMDIIIQDAANGAEQMNFTIVIKNKLFL